MLKDSEAEDCMRRAIVIAKSVVAEAIDHPTGHEENLAITMMAVAIFSRLSKEDNTFSS